LLEDVECLDVLLGRFAYRYELLDEAECFVRAKSFAEDVIEFPQGMFEDFDAEDWRIFERMKGRIRSYSTYEDTALVFPLAIKEHIDHFIVREAAAQVACETEKVSKASFYFMEDKPFRQYVYRAYPERMIDLAFTHYPSQVEEIFKTGILLRGEALRRAYHTGAPSDQLYRYIPAL